MKKILTVVVVFLAIFMFTGCGAPKVATTMTINDNFEGTRVMSFDFSESGELFKNVTDAFDKMAATAKEKLPSQLTMEMSGKTMVFTLSFTSKDDYFQKAKALLELGKSDITPVVTFENYGKDNPFKTGVSFEENFSTLDLMRWLFDAISEKKDIDGFDSYSSQYWSMGQNCTTKYGDKTSTGTRAGINDSQDNSFPELTVTTTLNRDGTIAREMYVEADSDSKAALAERGVDLDSYMAALATEGITHSKEDLSWATKYTYSFTAANSEELAQKTDACLKGSGASFSVTMATPKDETDLGRIILGVEDNIDCSYFVSSKNDYLGRYRKINATLIVPGDYSYDLNEHVSSALELPEGLKEAWAQIAGDGENVYYDGAQTAISYYPQTGQVYRMYKGYIPAFEKVGVSLDIKGEDNIDFTLSLDAFDLMGQDMNSLFKDALSCNPFFDNESSISGEMLELAFKSQTPRNIVTGVGELMYTYVGNKDVYGEEGDQQYAESRALSLSVKASDANSNLFKKVYEGSIDFDFSNLVGDRDDVVFNVKVPSFSKAYHLYSGEIQDGLKEEIPKDLTVGSRYYTAFYISRVNVWIIGAFVLAGVVLIGLLIFLILKKKKSAPKGEAPASYEAAQSCETQASYEAAPNGETQASYEAAPMGQTQTSYETLRNEGVQPDGGYVCEFDELTDTEWSCVPQENENASWTKAENYPVVYEEEHPCADEFDEVTPVSEIEEVSEFDEVASVAETVKAESQGYGGSVDTDSTQPPKSERAEIDNPDDDLI